MPRMKRMEPTASIPTGDTDSGSQTSGQAEEGKLSFFDRLRQMTEQAWDNHLVYVYRRWPHISRSDQPHYIDTVSIARRTTATHNSGPRPRPRRSWSKDGRSLTP